MCLLNCPGKIKFKPLKRVPAVTLSHSSAVALLPFSAIPHFARTKMGESEREQRQIKERDGKVSICRQISICYQCYYAANIIIIYYTYGLCIQFVLMCIVHVHTMRFYRHYSAPYSRYTQNFQAQIIPLKRIVTTTHRHTHTHRHPLAPILAPSHCHFSAQRFSHRVGGERCAIQKGHPRRAGFCTWKRSSVYETAENASNYKYWGRYNSGWIEAAPFSPLSRNLPVDLLAASHIGSKKTHSDQIHWSSSKFFTHSRRLHYKITMNAQPLQ